jgi:hypothetical protein
LWLIERQQQRKMQIFKFQLKWEKNLLPSNYPSIEACGKLERRIDGV